MKLFTTLGMVAVAILVMETRIYNKNQKIAWLEFSSVTKDMEIASLERDVADLREEVKELEKELLTVTMVRDRMMAKSKTDYMTLLMSALTDEEKMDFVNKDTIPNAEAFIKKGKGA